MVTLPITINHNTIISAGLDFIKRIIDEKTGTKILTALCRKWIHIA